MKIKLIVNPVSGQGGIRHTLPEVIRVLNEGGLEADVVFTRQVGDAKFEARKASDDGFRFVAVWGGDGTINEVINGIDLRATTVGIIPGGTVNLLAKEVGIPPNPLDATKVILCGVEKRIDLGVAGKRYFFLAASCGFDAEVVAEVSLELKRALGRAAYLVTGVRKLLGYKPVKMSIRCEGEERVRLGYLVVISNTKGYGGEDICVNPSARLDDGLLDICIFKKKGVLDLIRYAGGVLLRRHTQFSDVEFFQAKSLTVDPEEPILVQTDSEVTGWAPMDFRICPRLLKILVPKRDGEK